MTATNSPATDGSYAHTLSAERIDDLLQLRTRAALDEHGSVAALATVASLAYRRGQERRAP